MAKKKSVKQDEVKEAVQDNVNEGTLEAEQTDTSETSDQISPDNVLRPTNPENMIDGMDELSTTGEIVMDDGAYIDNQLLGRLRQAYLTPSEVYREAQIFASQALDVNVLLTSGESVLVHNLIEVLRMMDIWNANTLSGLKDAESKTREVTERYLLHCLRHGLVNAIELVDLYADALQKASPETRDGIMGFGDKLRSAFVNMISQALDDVVEYQQALTRLCAHLDSRIVGRMLYDPSPIVRISVIRALMSRSSLDINDLSVALILLKDRDEQVDTALMRLFAKFASCPELVIPQLLVSWTTASEQLKPEILDVFRSYGNDAVAPMMAALDDTRNDIYQAIRHMIAQVPQRYTDALLAKAAHFRTRDDVRSRILDILRVHKDEPRRAEISRVLKSMLTPANDDYPEWTAPDSREKFLKPATDNADVYAGLLDDKALEAFSQTCDDAALGRLLNDASETVQINALRIIRHRGTVPAASEAHVRVWLKSSSPALAAEALDAFLAYEKDIDKAVAVVIDSFKHGESDDVKQHFFKVMLGHQTFVDGMIRAFYQTPRRCAGFIMKFLSMEPGAQTLAGILHGLDRSQSVACVAETMMCLYRSRLKFDDMPVRPILLAHIREPLSFGQHGFQARLFAIKLLSKFLRADETPDRATISALQAFYKESKHAELKFEVKNVLKKLGEDLFDLDDEDDDFEDLNDEDDDF